MLQYKRERCSKCGVCVQKCPFGAISLDDGCLNINENCVECGICAKNCPCDVFITAAEELVDLSRYHGFWVVAVEETSERLSKVTLELLSEARRLADKKNEKVTLWIVGETAHKGWEEDASKVGCDKILLVPCGLLRYDAKIYTDALEQMVNSYKPEVVLFPATVNGRDLAPKAAARLQTGLTADCTGLSLDEKGNLVQIRPTYGGNIIASITTPNHRPQMASVRPNVMKITANYTAKPQVEYFYEFQADLASKINLLEQVLKNSTFASLDEANIIIAGGYGLKGKESFQQLFQLSNQLNAAAAATRKAIDEGWAPTEIQVGQTGMTVSPDLYIAFGISGALQHTLGMKDAKKIIAINNDPAAPIFEISDVAILGDAQEILEKCCQMLETVQRS